MDADDEFGHLYEDIGPETRKSLGVEPLVDNRVGDLEDEDEDDEELLYGKSSSSVTALSSKAPMLPASAPRRTGVQLPLVSKEVDHDELLLYGQLYGVTAETPVKADGESRSVEIRVLPDFRVENRNESREDSSPLEIWDDSSSFDPLADRGANPGAETPLGRVGLGAGIGERQAETNVTVSQGRVLEGFANRSFPPDNDVISVRRAAIGSESSRLMNSPPGLSASARVQLEFVTEEYEEREEMVRDWEEEGIEGKEEGEGLEVQADEEDWDSDSEDDIQIVLNDEAPLYIGDRPADGNEVEGSEDEDEEDLVIVTGDDDALPLEEQDWEEQPMPGDAQQGALGATHALGSERASGGEDRGPGGKGSGGPGGSSGVPRIGYSGQGYHAHHMQYKYVRPGAGAGAATGMGLSPSRQGSPQAGVSSGRGSGGWGPGRGTAGRGDWSSGGGRGIAQRTSQGSGGMASWGGSRLSNGMEFNLPPTKTVFDVDIDILEEKPWRRPGIDITDYFNFSFSESSWKQYCRQLSQLRLEATMQSKIRVYESGRSEQEYDPDLPPELAAATSMQEAAGDLNLHQHRQQDGGPGAGSGRGRGTGRGRVMLPTGRAIQVEGGGGERRPSADVRRQRSRDSDAIVLVDASEHEPPASGEAHEGNTACQGEEEEQRGSSVPEKERRFYRSGAHAPWEMDGPPHIWERDNMPMVPGPMSNLGPHGGGMMPGLRMDVDGPVPFPLRPVMAMHQTGHGPNFNMFTNTSFGPPPVGRGGMVRPPLYNGPRPSVPQQLAVPQPDVFPPMMVPLEYNELPRRRTPPPRLTPPLRTPQVLPVDWDDDLSNGSAAHWTSREGRNHREINDMDGGNGDWVGDGVNRRESNYTLRRGQETDRSCLRERTVEDASLERSDEHKRSISQERHLEESDWDPGNDTRTAKKQKVLSHQDKRGKSLREEYVHSKALRNSVRKEEPSRSWEGLKEQVASEDGIDQKRHDASHIKASDGNAPPPVDDIFGSQQKEVGWNDRQDVAKDRRQPRERDELQRWKVKDDNGRQHQIREDQERERRRDDRDDQIRERRHGKKDNENDRIFRDHRSRKNIEDFTRPSRDREETRPKADLSVASTDNKTDYREKHRREDDRAKVKSRLEDFRETESDGKLRPRTENVRERWVEEGRDGNGRLQGRFEDVKESGGRVKERLDDFKERSDGRVKGHPEDTRETDGRGKGRADDVRETDGRGKGWLDILRVTEGRERGHSADFRDIDVRLKSRQEDFTESEERVEARFEEQRESVGKVKDFWDTDGRSKARSEDVREIDGRLKVHSEDLRESDGRVKDRFEVDKRMKSRLEISTESEGRVKGRSGNYRDSDVRAKSRLDNYRESDARLKGRLEDGRENDVRIKGRLEDARESDSRLKRRVDDLRESDARLKGRLDDLRESDGSRVKGRVEELRDSDGRSRWYDKDDDPHPWDDRRKHEKASRADSSHATRNHNTELQKVIIEDHRLSREKRSWEGSLTTKEVPSERNGSLSILPDEKSYRSLTDGSKKRRVEEYRRSAQFDKATRDSDDIAAPSIRHKEKKVVIQKRIEDQITRQSHPKEVTSRQLRVFKDDNVLPVENGSSDGEEADRRGRSKLERWTSRKERDAISAMVGGTLQKRQNSESRHDEAPSTSQEVGNERKHTSRVEQLWKDDRKERQRLSMHFGQRHYESEPKEPLTTHASGGGNTSLEPATAAPKDVVEKRKERLERLRLQAEETAVKRQKTSDLVSQGVAEVKQERPARKRRWGNG